MVIRFVIPAAGTATRFGGLPKELLPISEQDCGLTHAVRLAWRLGECQPVVITTRDKRAMHRAAIDATGLSVDLIKKPNPTDGDMWGSVCMGIDVAMNGGLILPDTVPTVTHLKLPTAPINFGCFVTERPERFSCLTHVGSPLFAIATKRSDLAPQLAWGMVTWAQGVAGRLRTVTSHYDRAFEDVAREFSYGVFMLAGYHDLGSFSQYLEFLNEHRRPGHVTPELPRPIAQGFRNAE